MTQSANALPPEPAAPSIVSVPALLGVGVASVLGFVSLLPLAQERSREAQQAPPDLVSVNYMRLSVEQSPEDAGLRLAVVRRMLHAGLLDEAAQLLAPLLPEPSAEAAPSAAARETSPTAAASSPARQEALQLAVELEHQRWMAIAPAHEQQRERARQRLLQRLRARQAPTLDAQAAERVADISAQVGALRLRAQVLANLAFRGAGGEVFDREQRLERAAAAYLELEEPLTAAQLWSDCAERYPAPAGLRCAVRALSLASTADRPEQALAMFRRLDERFPDHPKLLELGLAFAARVDPKQAREIAERLQAEQLTSAPANASSPEDALPSEKPLSPQEAIAQARAHWQLERLAELTQGEPATRAALVERVALLEALGRPEQALQALQSALAGPLGSDRALWQLVRAVQLRAGRTQGALETMALMAKRFGECGEGLYLRSDLLAARGELASALALLSRCETAPAGAHQRRMAELAWELSDLSTVQRSLTALVASPEATSADFERLSRTLQSQHEYRQASERALEGYQRFARQPLLQQAVSAAVASGDDRLLLHVLSHPALAACGFSQEPEYFQLKTQAHQRQTAQALRLGQLDLARRASANAGATLQAAERAGLGQQPEYARWVALQRQQRFSLALQGDDRDELAKLYPSQAEQLSPRQRVHVLHRLGRDEEAAQLAIEAAGAADLPLADRNALESEARWLTLSMPRQLALAGESVQMQGLSVLGVGARGVYTWPELQLQLEASATELSPSLGVADLAQPRTELSVGATAAFGGTSLTAGMVSVSSGSAQPFASASQRLLDGESVDLRLDLRFNARSQETAALRAAGAEDALALVAEVDWGGGFYSSGRALGQAFWDHRRRSLGWGGILDAGLGRNFSLSPEVGVASARLVGYWAPRFATLEGERFLSESTRYFGVGGALHRGRMGWAPAAGLDFSYLVDGSVGWLAQQQQWGWSGRAGLGTSVVGQDLLSLSVRGSNVFGTLPGFAVYGVRAEYAASQW